MIFHDVEDGKIWSNAWKQGPGSRHEMFAKIGMKCRNFRDPNNPDSVGIFAEVPDMDAFRALLDSEVGKKAMAEDRLKIETMKVLEEFTP